MPGGRGGRFARGLSTPAVCRLGVVDLAGDRGDIAAVIPEIVHDAAILDFDHGRGHRLHERAVVAREDHRAFIGDERLGERIDRLHVEMIARLVEHEHVEGAEQEPRHAEPGPLAARQHADPLLDRLAPEEHRAGQVENLLLLRARAGGPLQVGEHGVVRWQAHVHVLGVDTELAAVAPFRLACERRE